eukprot:8651066-Pyramimonas_sp.AAC.1
MAFPLRCRSRCRGRCRARGHRWVLVYLGAVRGADDDGLALLQSAERHGLVVVAGDGAWVMRGDALGWGGGAG